MDRDRDRRYAENDGYERRAYTHAIRPRDIPPEDQYGTGRGQSYRPGAARDRSPPPRGGDSYRARSPPRRPYAPRRSPPRADTYRRRSPSPRDRFRDARGGGDSYRGRPRSPPVVRREDLPRDDLFRRDPERDARRDFRDDRDFRDEREFRDERGPRGDDRAYPGRSPAPRFRERSPLPMKRGREPSPMDSRGRRTPPPAKRERLASPQPRGRFDDHSPSRPTSPPRRYSPDAPSRVRRTTPPRGVTRNYRLNSRSPLARNQTVDPRKVDDWRRPPPRSPSPPRAPRPDHADYNDRGRDSGNTSRRSSPPVNPSRFAPQQAQQDDRPLRPAPREPYVSREMSRAAQSPEPQARVEPAHQPAREREYDNERNNAHQDGRIPPPREPYRSDDAPPPRAPPTGPAGQRGPQPTMAPPTGPAAAMPPVSAHARAPAVPPSGPRGDMPARGGFAGRGRGGFGNDFAPRGRGGFVPGFRGGRMPGFGRGASYEREQEPVPVAPPSGPRASLSGPSSQGPPAPFRQANNPTTTTYPRSQRFAPNGQPIPDPPTGPRAASTSSASSSYRRPPPPEGPSSGTVNSSVPTGPASDRRRESDLVHPTLRDISKIVPNGVKAPPLVDRSRLDKLAEETDKLRKAIADKEVLKRKHLRDWEKAVRESESAGFKSDLADQAVRGFEDEGVTGWEGAGAAF